MPPLSFSRSNAILSSPLSISLSPLLPLSLLSTQSSLLHVSSFPVLISSFALPLSLPSTPPVLYCPPFSIFLSFPPSLSTVDYSILSPEFVLISCNLISSLALSLSPSLYLYHSPSLPLSLSLSLLTLFRSISLPQPLSRLSPLLSFTL